MLHGAQKIVTRSIRVCHVEKIIQRAGILLEYEKISESVPRHPRVLKHLSTRIPYENCIYIVSLHDVKCP